MTIKLFVKQDCPRCPEAKHVVRDFETVEVYDVGDVDGLAEASFYNILATPSVIVLDSAGHEIRGWRGQVPDRQTLTELLAL